MLHIRRRAPVLCVLFTLFAQTLLAQSPDARPSASAAPQSATTNDTSRAQTANEREDAAEVQRQLRQQRDEIERLRAALQEQLRQMEELRARVERTEQSQAAVVAQVQGMSQPGGGAPSNAVLQAGGTTQVGGTAQAGAVTQQPAVFRDTLPGARETVAAGAASAGGATSVNGSTPTSTQKEAQAGKPEDRLGRVEEQVKRTSETVAKQLGSISFSGDIRFRYESLYGQLNASPSDSDPAVVGNPLSSRQRFRLRARLGLRGQFTKEFEWGLRLNTGAYPDVIGPNQTLTDFFSHKNFALDQAYLSYKPARVPGLQFQAGKFEVPWTRTEMTLDNDLTVEGLNESYTRTFKKSTLKSLSLIAWQLPFLERASAFVLGADGRVDFEQSRRQGRDLALYGGQMRARLEPSSKVALTVSAADLYFSGTQFITPAQFFGANVQIPVTVRIPATATTPAQTVVAQVSIPRDQLVSGNANLGISTASNNAVNRDGRLSSGFNLVDLIGRLELSHSKQWPVMLLLDYVMNTQAHDVVTAGASGLNVLQKNNENKGYWAEFQVGKTQARGDWLFNYAFIRIEKDAVLTPFNGSDFNQQSDSRIQRFTASYAADPRVTLSLTAYVTSRPNGLLGAFGATPPGSLNRPTTRLQLDTVFRF